MWARDLPLVPDWGRAARVNYVFLEPLDESRSYQTSSSPRVFRQGDRTAPTHRQSDVHPLDADQPGSVGKNIPLDFEPKVDARITAQVLRTPDYFRIAAFHFLRSLRQKELEAVVRHTKHKGLLKAVSVT